MVKGKLRVIEGGMLAFYCPGCRSYHYVHIDSGEHPVWNFNGNYDAPTFTPSILVRSGHYINKDSCWCKYNEEHPDDQVPYRCTICHTFITNGKIQYLNDCTHELAGQIIDMILPDEELSQEV